MDNLYDLSMDIEILREAYASLLADFIQLFKEKNIDYEKDFGNFWVKLFLKVQDKYYSIIGIKTFKEANKLYGVYELANEMVQEALNGKWL